MEQKQVMDRKIIIGHLFRDQLNSYGDGGNVDVLKKRLTERHIKVEVREYAINENIDFDEIDLIYMGGGKNREKRLVIDCLRDWTTELKEYIEQDKPILVTGTSLSIFGKACMNGEEEIPGLGILSLITTNLEEEQEGHVQCESLLPEGNKTLIGYRQTNDSYMHDYKPLAKDEDGQFEGLVHRHFIGTSLHGPVLAKNSFLADILLSWACEKKLGNIRMINLSDQLENKLRKTVIKKNV